MRKVYSKKMIFDYVNGNDLDGYNIEDLENDVDFMMQVIDYTGDKNIIRLCGDDVLNNYVFVKYIVKKFSNDKDFIVSFANDYLDKNEDELDYDCFELNVIMSNIIGYTENFGLSMYNVNKIVFFHSIMSVLKGVIEEEGEDVRDFGLGFLVIYEMFDGREEVLNFFAEKFIDDIFYNQEGTFEKNVHNITKKLSFIKNKGTHLFLIDYIRNFDSFLADYVTTHLDLLKEPVKSLKRVECNWKNYTINDFYQKFLMFQHEVLRYYNENDECLYSFSVEDLIEHLIYKFELEEEYNECFGDCLKQNDFSECFNFNKDVVSLADYKFYKFGDNLIRNIFKKNIVIEDDDYIIKKDFSSNQKAKILMLENKN